MLHAAWPMSVPSRRWWGQGNRMLSGQLWAGGHVTAASSSGSELEVEIGAVKAHCGAVLTTVRTWRYLASLSTVSGDTLSHSNK